MKTTDLSGKTREELLEMLAKEKADLVKVRFAVASRQESNYKKMGIIRKNIARIMTQLRIVDNDNNE